MADPWLQQVHDWQAFYSITGTAAATLMGLMFVVVSLGTTSMRSERSESAVRAFVTPTVVYFTTVLVLAAIMSAPLLTPLRLSVLLALSGLGGAVYIGAIGVRAQWRTSQLAQEDWYWYFGLPVLGYLLLVGAAAGVELSSVFGLLAAAVAELLFIVIGIRNAWDLAIWLAQQRPAE